MDTTNTTQTGATGISLCSANTLAVIKVLCRVRGYPPTTREIAEATDRHQTAVYETMKKLEKAKLISWTAQRRGTLMVSDPSCVPIIPLDIYLRDIWKGGQSERHGENGGAGGDL